MHARVRRGPDGYLIEEIAGALNGTRVNAVRIAAGESHRLQERDAIRIGNVAFEFRAEVSATPVRSAPFTIVDDPGDAPTPFDDEAPPEAAAPAVATPERHPISQEPPRPTPGSELPRPRPTPAAERPGPSPTPEPRDQAIGAVREGLAQLDRDLAPFIERLTALAEAASVLERQLGDADAAPVRSPGSGAIPPPLSRLVSELEAEGGQERYRELRRLLEELASSPTDVNLLLQVADQAPAIRRLLDLHRELLTLARPERR